MILGPGSDEGVDVVQDRKSGGEGKRGDLGGRRIIKKKKQDEDPSQVWIGQPHGAERSGPFEAPGGAARLQSRPRVCGCLRGRRCVFFFFFFKQKTAYEMLP